MTREEAVYMLVTNYPNSCYGLLREAVDMAIEALKEEPRIVAKWLPYEYGSELWHKCSNCGKPTQYQHYYKAFDGEEHLMRTEIQNYCRYCGARMEGEE